MKRNKQRTKSNFGLAKAVGLMICGLVIEYMAIVEWRDSLKEPPKEKVKSEKVEAKAKYLPVKYWESI